MTLSVGNRAECLFCGTTTAKMSREHVLPAWLFNEIARCYPSKAPWKQVGSHTPKPVFGQSVVGGFCQKHCNEGWMSELEQAVRPVLMPLMFSGCKTSVLHASEQRTLAAWAYKTMLVMDRFVGPKQLSPALYPGFYRDRVPGDAVRIYAYGYVDGIPVPSELRYQFEAIQVVGPRRIDDARSALEFEHIEGVLLTLRLVHCVLQVEWLSRGQFRHDHQGGKQARIWPAANEPMAWPPNPILDDRGLNALAGRRMPVQDLHAFDRFLVRDRA